MAFKEKVVYTIETEGNSDIVVEKGDDTVRIEQYNDVIYVKMKQIEDLILVLNKFKPPTKRGGNFGKNV